MLIIKQDTIIPDDVTFTAVCVNFYFKILLLQKLLLLLQFCRALKLKLLLHAIQSTITQYFHTFLQYYKQLI